MSRDWVICAAMAAATPAAAGAQGDASAAVARLVDRFDAARAAFDPAALADTLAPDYEEVSPLGEVDSRDAVLGFYAPAKRSPAPPVTSAERTVRVAGDVALATRRVSLPAPGGVVRSLRVRYVAQRTVAGWKLLSVQYTPVRPGR